MTKKRPFYYFLIVAIFVVLSSFLMCSKIDLHATIDELNENVSYAQNIISVLQIKIEELLEENTLLYEKHDLIVNDPYELREQVTQTGRFIPDFKPIQDEYAISQGFSANHPSIDFSTSKGNSVFAAGAGVVIEAFYDLILGNVIKIDHLNSYITLYAHLDSFKVSENDFIDKGQIIGQVGNTGYSTNPHLHFQIIFENEPIDPTIIMTIHTFQN